MVTAPKSEYFLLVSTTVGVKDLYPPAELMAPHEGDRHLRILTFGLGLEPLLHVGVCLL
jgi:hypothetical protein